MDSSRRHDHEFSFGGIYVAFGSLEPDGSWIESLD